MKIWFVMSPVKTDNAGLVQLRYFWILSYSLDWHLKNMSYTLMKKKICFTASEKYRKKSEFSNLKFSQLKSACFKY